MAKHWPMPENERAQLTALFARVDEGRWKFRDAKASGDEDAIDDAADHLFRQNLAMLEWTSRLTEGSRPVYDDEKGWASLGAPSLAATAGDAIYERYLPNPFEAEEWLAVAGDAADEPERPEPAHVEKYLRTMARTGWWGLDAQHRKWITKVRDEARTLAQALHAWLEATK